MRFSCTCVLLCDANDPASWPRPRIARGQAQLVATLTQVVLVSVHHHSPPNDRVLPRQGDHLVREADLGGAALCRHIAQVPGVAGALGVLGSAVAAAIRVEMRTSAGAAIGVVTKLR